MTKRTISLNQEEVFLVLLVLLWIKKIKMYLNLRLSFMLFPKFVKFWKLTYIEIHFSVLPQNYNVAKNSEIKMTRNFFFLKVCSFFFVHFFFFSVVCYFLLLLCFVFFLNCDSLHARLKIHATTRHKTKHKTITA